MPSTSHVLDVVPYLIVADAAAALAFYVAGLGAIEDHRLLMSDGKVGHAELRFGDRRVYVADEFPRVSDPFGHRWNVQQQVRAMTPAEMQAGIDEQADA